MQFSFFRATKARPAGATPPESILCSFSHGSMTPIETCHPLPTASDVADSLPKWPTSHRAYTCLLGCFLLMFNSWGLVNAYGTFASYYMQTLLPGSDILLLNLIGSTQSFIVLSLSFVVGRLLDAGHARQLIGAGACLVTLGMFLLSVVNGGGHNGQGRYGLIWLTQGLVVGLGMACFFVSSSQVAATWFVRRKSFAIGVVASGASVAGLIYPLMTRFLIAKVGFNIAVRYVATVTAVTSVVAFITARPNPEFRIRKPKRWSDARVWFDSDAFCCPSFVWFTAGVCFMFFGFYAVFFNLEEWAAAAGIAYKEAPPGLHIPGQDKKYDALRTFWLLSIMNACSTFGRIGSALLSERFGALNTHVLSVATGSLLCLVLWTQSSTLATALAFVILYGVISGAVIGLPPSCVAEILGKDDANQAKLGQWTGMMYTASAVFALTGPVVAGHLVSRYHSYITVQAWSGGCLLAASVCILMARMYAKQEAPRGRIKSLSHMAERMTIWANEEKRYREMQMGRRG